MAGKTVLITGAGSGIGRAAALVLAGQGCRVLVTDRDEASARAVAAEIAAGGGTALAQLLDVTSEAAWDAAVQALLGAWGRLDYLVASAGSARTAPVADTSLADWRSLLAVNLDGVFLAARAAARQMAEGGAVVVVSSASGRKAAAGAASYCASKAAVTMLVRCLALELAPRIRVNAVLPGAVRTPLWQQAEFWPQLVASAGSEEEAWAQLAAGSPLQRLTEPDEVAQAIAYLLSEAAASVTGAEWVMDGGYSA